MGEFFQAAIKAVAVLITAVINFAQAPTEQAMAPGLSEPAHVAAAQSTPEPVHAMVDSVKKIADATLASDKPAPTIVAQSLPGVRPEIRRKVIVILPEVAPAPRIVGEDIVEAEIHGKVIAIISEEIPAEKQEQILSLLEPMG